MTASLTKNNYKYEILSSNVTTLDFVDVFDDPIYADLIAIFFLENMSSDPFQKIESSYNIIIQSSNLSFRASRQKLEIFSPIDIPITCIIDVPFEVSTEASNWFIQKLKDTGINVKNPTYTKENAMSVANLIKFFKITI